MPPVTVLIEAVTIGGVFLVGVSIVVLAFRAMKLGLEFEVGVEGPWIALHLRVGSGPKSGNGRRSASRRKPASRPG
jgi:hypothetical protein